MHKIIPKNDTFYPNYFPMLGYHVYDPFFTEDTMNIIKVSQAWCFEAKASL